MNIISRIIANVVRTCTKATVAEEAHVRKRRVTWGPNETRTYEKNPLDRIERPSYRKRVTWSEEMEQAVSEQPLHIIVNAVLYLIMKEVYCVVS